MRGKIKTARRKASKLHGATASWVSLVDAGANQTPFTITKAAKGANPMAIKKRTSTTGRLKKSHQKLKTNKDDAAKDVTVENRIAKMVFSTEHFEDEAAVEAYLEEAEWEAEETSITKSEDGSTWEVRADGLVDDDFLKMQKVETDDEGVDAYVGQIEVTKTDDADVEDEDGDDKDGDEESVAKSDDDTDAEEDDEIETVDAEGDAAASEEEKGKGKKKPYMKSGDKPKTKLSKRAEFIKKRKEAERNTEKKFDAWDARYSKGNTLAKTLQDGMAWDGVPPGFYEVQAAFNSAVSNIVSGEEVADANKQEALNKAALDYAEIIGGLDTFFDDYIEAESETVQAAFENDEEQLEAVKKWADEFGDYVAGISEAPQKIEKSDAAPAAIDYNEFGDRVATSIADALQPVMKEVGEIAETVQAMATRTPTKKAADPDDTAPAGARVVSTKGGKTPANDDKTRSADTMTKAVFG